MLKRGEVEQPAVAAIDKAARECRRRCLRERAPETSECDGLQRCIERRSREVRLRLRRECRERFL